MDEPKAIQVSFQLPAGALEGFSRLVEQLRLLAETVNGGGAQPPAGVWAESGESGRFDLAHFQAMRQTMAPPESVRTAFPPLKGAEAVHAEASRETAAPDSAGAAWEDLRTEPSDRTRAESGAALADPAAAEAIIERRILPAEDPSPGTEESPAPEVQTVRPIVEEPPEEIPAVRAEPETQVAEAPAVRLEPESGLPETEAVWTDPWELLPPPTAEEAFSGVETPVGAGFAVAAEPESAGGRRSSVTEELIAAGPAPLTAEAVSLAFQRDGRRYDNGFPLY